MPTNFPSNLKELMHRGWSKEPKVRPPIKEFKSALMTMLTLGEKLECTQATYNNNSLKAVLLNEREAQLESQKKCNEMLKPRMLNFNSQTLPGTKEQEKREQKSGNDSNLELSSSNTLEDPFSTSKEIHEWNKMPLDLSEEMDKKEKEKEKFSKGGRDRKISLSPFQATSAGKTSCY
jgi:hypothetical protein